MVLIRSTSSFTNKKAIQPDDLGQSALHTNLTRILLNSSSEPLTIAIMGQRGMGKSYFIQNWALKSSDASTKVIVFNAWLYDNYSHPLIALLNFVNSNFSDINLEKPILLASELIENGVHTLAPFSKILLCISWLLKFVKPLFKSKEANYSNPQEYEDAVIRLRKSIENSFRSLSELNKSLIVVVDELDRCKPSFALSLLEVIKHYLDIDGIKFVIVANDTQLYNSYRHEYGGELFDANEYFRRFFDYSFSFPSPPLEKFLYQSVTKFGLQSITPYGDDLVKITTLIRDKHKLTLRDLEQIFGIFSFAINQLNVKSIEDSDLLLVLLTLCVLKLLEPTLLDVILNAHSPNLPLRLSWQDFAVKTAEQNPRLDITSLVNHKYRAIIAIGIGVSEDKLLQSPWDLHPMYGSFEGIFNKAIELTQGNLIERFILSLNLLHSSETKSARSLL